MIAMLDLSREAYFYAQALDNQGGTEYWRITEGGTVSEKLLPEDPSLSAVRSLIDTVQSHGRVWHIAHSGLPCRLINGGNCVLTVTPETRDSGGRLSPVLLLFNALGPSRQQAAVAFMSIPSTMEREVSNDYEKIARHLKRIIALPRWIIYLHMAIFSEKHTHD